MFYFFFESRGKEEDPVVIWITGGPGCSSELAVFYENGPFTIANNMSLVWNKFGWDTVSNRILPLLLGSPVSSGLSLTVTSLKLNIPVLLAINFMQSILRRKQQTLTTSTYVD